MQVMIDHALAFLIAGAIIFTLAGLALRRQNAAIDSTQYYNAKQATHALVEMIEQDLANIGAGMVEPIGAIENHTAESFRFRAQIDRGVAGWQVVEYSWEELGSVSLADGQKPTYRVTRYVGGTPTGSSFDGITEFDITLRDHFLVEVTNPAQYDLVRRIDVSVAAVSQLGVAETIEETHWTRAIRPLNL